MVYGTCLRVLQRHEDVQDACQAAFLVLSRNWARIQAAGIAVGPWLHGTAYRISLHARRTQMRRIVHESRYMKGKSDFVDDRQAAWSDLAADLDSAVEELPTKLRQPVVLCYLAGFTRKEAAAELGVPLRTLERSLQQALELLRKRFARRGTALSSALLASLLLENAVVAVPPEASQGMIQAWTGQTASISAQATRLADQVPMVSSWVAWLPSLRWLGFAAGGALLIFLVLLWWHLPLRQDKTPAMAEADLIFQPSPQDDAKTITAYGRIVDIAGRPLQGVTILLLSRPVRLLGGDRLEAIPDPLATVAYERGRFRVLARTLTDADGRYRLTAEREIPDRATGAKLFQTLPFVCTQEYFRFAEHGAEFRNIPFVRSRNHGWSTKPATLPATDFQD